MSDLDFDFIDIKSETSSSPSTPSLSYPSLKSAPESPLNPTIIKPPVSVKIEAVPLSPNAVPLTCTRVPPQGKAKSALNDAIRLLETTYNSKDFTPLQQNHVATLLHVSRATSIEDLRKIEQEDNALIPTLYQRYPGNVGFIGQLAAHRSRWSFFIESDFVNFPLSQPSSPHAVKVESFRTTPQPTVASPATRPAYMALQPTAPVPTPKVEATIKPSTQKIPTPPEVPVITPKTAANPEMSNSRETRPTPPTPTPAIPAPAIPTPAIPTPTPPTPAIPTPPTQTPTLIFVQPTKPATTQPIVITTQSTISTPASTQPLPTLATSDSSKPSVEGSDSLSPLQTDYKLKIRLARNLFNNIRDKYRNSQVHHPNITYHLECTDKRIKKLEASRPSSDIELVEIIQKIDTTLGVVGQIPEQIAHCQRSQPRPKPTPEQRQKKIEKRRRADDRKRQAKQENSQQSTRQPAQQSTRQPAQKPTHQPAQKPTRQPEQQPEYDTSTTQVWNQTINSSDGSYEYDSSHGLRVLFRYNPYDLQNFPHKQRQEYLIEHSYAALIPPWAEILEHPSSSPKVFSLIVKRLVSSVKSPHVDLSKNNILHYLVMQYDPSILESLLSSSEDARKLVGLANARSETPLLLSAMFDRPHHALILLRYGALSSVHQRGRGKKNIFHVLLSSPEYNNPSWCKVIRHIMRESNPKAQDIDGIPVISPALRNILVGDMNINGRSAASIALEKATSHHIALLVLQSVCGCHLGDTLDSIARYATLPPTTHAFALDSRFADPLRVNKRKANTFAHSMASLRSINALNAVSDILEAFPNAPVALTMVNKKGLVPAQCNASPGMLQLFNKYTPE